MTEEKIQQADVHLAAPGSLNALRAASKVSACPVGLQACITGWRQAGYSAWNGLPAPHDPGEYELRYSIQRPSESQGHGAPTGQSRTFETALAAPSYEARPDALAPAALLTPELSARIEVSLECALLWTEGSEAHPRIEQVLADFRAAEAPSSVSQGMAQDAARYRWLRERVRAGYKDVGSLAPSFRLPRVHPVGNIMQGSVAQHFDAAIDAALLPLPQPTGERE